MSVRIIDQFEVIYIQHNNRKIAPITLCTPKFNFSLFIEMAAIIQVGQGIRPSHKLQVSASRFKVQFKAGAIEKEKIKRPGNHGNNQNDGKPRVEWICEKIDLLRL